MNGAQIKMAYLRAKILFDVATATLHQLTEHLPYGDPDRIEEVIDAEMAFRDALNLHQLSDDLRAIEELLLRWAHQRVSTDPATAEKYAQAAEHLDKVFTTRNPRIRQEVIRLALLLPEE